MVDTVAPWYVKFWAGWSSVLADKELSIKLVRYEDLLAHPTEQFHQVSQFCDPSITRTETEKWVEDTKQSNTRKNKATIGRSQSLPLAALDQLHRLASYYKQSNFKLVGL